MAQGLTESTQHYQLGRLGTKTKTASSHPMIKSFWGFQRLTVTTPENWTDEKPAHQNQATQLRRPLLR